MFVLNLVLLLLFMFYGYLFYVLKFFFFVFVLLGSCYEIMNMIFVVVIKLLYFDFFV
jgi:hypothetical protein